MIIKRKKMMKITIQKKNSEVIPVEKKTHKPKPINIDDEDFFGKLSNKNIHIHENIKKINDDDNNNDNNNIDSLSIEEVEGEEVGEIELEGDDELVDNEKIIDIDMKDYLREDSLNVNLYYFEHPWLKELESKSNDSRDELINQYLKIGYMVTNLLRNEVVVNSTPIIEPIEKKLNEIEHRNEVNISMMNTKVSENLDRMKLAMDKFTEFTNKSSFKGAMGENIIETLITQYFPDDVIENTSQRTAEADYHLKCREGNLNILVESKFYQTIVQKKEIEKFKRDLVKVGYPIGIFVSISSGIVGKKRFDIEKINDHQLILYVPNSGLDGSSIIWSILFAKELNKFMLQHNSFNQIERNISDLHDLFDNFHDIYQHFSNLKMSILETRNNVIKHMDDLHHKTLEIHLNIHHLISGIKEKIQKELHILNMELNTDNNCGIDVSSKIEEMRNMGLEEEVVIMYEKLNEICIEKGIDIKIDEDNLSIWYGYLGKEEIFRIKVLTKKKEIVIAKYKMTMLFNMENVELLNRLF